MLRKIGFTLLCAASILSTSAYSMTNNALMPGVTLEYELKPNEPQMFINYWWGPIEAVCKITTQDDSDELVAEALVKKGKINGISLSQGQSAHVSVHPNETLRLSADSGAQVKITNLGQHSVKASCTSA